MKKAFLLKTLMLLLVLVGVMCSVAMAEQTPQTPQCAILYINNAKTTYDSAIDDCVLDNIKEKLSKKFTVVQSDAAIKTLADMGMTDLSMAERRDIIDALYGDGYDYIICLSVEPFQRKEKFSFFTQGIEMTATVPVKIIDVKSDKYIYNGKFVELKADSTAFGTVGNKSVAIGAIKKVNKSLNKVLEEKLLNRK